MELYAVRHGQTAWNAMKKMQGSVDIPLNEIGLAQAQETKNNLREIRVDRIFCSPLMRAKQTAAAINEQRGLPVVYDERLRERNYGEYEGANKASFNYNAMWEYGKDLHYEKAENVRDFFARVYDFLDELRARYPEESILLVAHAGVLKAVKCYADGMMRDEEIGPYLPANCGVSHYTLK